MPSPINGIEDRVLKGSATYFECLKFGSQKSTVDGVEKEKVMFLLEERSDFPPPKKIVSIYKIRCARFFASFFKYEA